MTMQRRHFQFIAETIRQLPRDEFPDANETAKFFAIRLAQTNPNFKTAKFLVACGIADGE